MHPWTIRRIRHSGESRNPVVSGPSGLRLSPERRVSRWSAIIGRRAANAACATVFAALGLAACRPNRLILEDGFTALEGGDLKTARACFDRVLDSTPGHPRATLGAATVLVRENQYRKARGMVTTLLSGGVEEPDRALAIELKNHLDGIIPPPEIRHGRWYVLCVGISDYRDDRLGDLRFADQDAIALAEWYRNSPYSPVNHPEFPGDVRVLRGAEATKTNIRAAIFEHLVQRAVHEEDAAVFYFSGHGYAVPAKALAGWDTDKSTAATMVSTAFGFDELQSLWSQIVARRKILVIDACHSGVGAKGDNRVHEDLGALVKGLRDTAVREERASAGAWEGGDAPAGTTPAPADDLTPEVLPLATGRIMLASCTSMQYSIESPDLEWNGRRGHGVFTHTLLRGLNGQADTSGAVGTGGGPTGDGKVSLPELLAFLQTEVLAAAKSASEGSTVMTPFVEMTDQSGDFVVSGKEW